MEHDLFSVIDYAQMIQCAPRSRAYAKALEHYVTPGCTVIDIGTGTGFFAVLACQYGAGHVVAIEPGEVIQIAKETAKKNNCFDRIEFFQGFSQDFKPEQKADVIISDLRGAMPLYQKHIPAIIDARERLLAENGILLPQYDTIHVALARSEDDQQIHDFILKPNEYGIDFTAGYETVINSPRWFHSKPEHILSKSQIFVKLDYARIETPNAAKKLSFTVEKRGYVDGLIMWFDADIAKGFSFSNGPDQDIKQYRSQFLPFEQSLYMETGDVVTVDLAAQLIAGTYVWSWQSEFTKSGQKEPQLSFKQSTFLGGLIKKGKD